MDEFEEEEEWGLHFEMTLSPGYLLKRQCTYQTHNLIKLVKYIVKCYCEFCTVRLMIN